MTERRLLDALRGSLASGKPFLGICLGLQALYEGSEEAPEIAGLGIMPGRVTRFEGIFKVPHVGWNQLVIRRPGRLFRGVEEGSFVYYCHSYYAPVTDETSARNRIRPDVRGRSRSEQRLGSAVPSGKIGRSGIAILRNFLESVMVAATGRRDVGARSRLSVAPTDD